MQTPENINAGTTMMVNTVEEENLLFNALKPDMRVLEFGGGMSTVAIAKRVKELVTIEHNKGWLEQYVTDIPKNVTLCYVPLNREPSDDYSDGLYEECKDYVEHPRLFLKEGKFDIVFIDGRARVACARLAAQEYLKEGGIIFIHDYRHPKPEYRRTEYEVVEIFLKRIDQAFAMAKFKVK
jgi:predicted O-methyltransferase YrrM